MLNKIAFYKSKCSNKITSVLQLVKTLWSSSLVRSAYTRLSNSNMSGEGMQERVIHELVRVLLSWVHSKIVVFSWQVMHNMLPTRRNLLRHGIVNVTGGWSGVHCVFREIIVLLITYLLSARQPLPYGIRFLGRRGGPCHFRI